MLTRARGCAASVSIRVSAGKEATALGWAVDAADAGGNPVVLVAHSGAGCPASLLLDQDLRLFCERAVPEPTSVLRSTVTLTNDARRDVRSTIIACSYPSDVMMQMACEGHRMMAEVATLRDLELIELPTGHCRCGVVQQSSPQRSQTHRAICNKMRSQTGGCGSY